MRATPHQAPLGSRRDIQSSTGLELATIQHIPVEDMLQLNFQDIPPIIRVLKSDPYDVGINGTNAGQGAVL